MGSSKSKEANRIDAAQAAAAAAAEEAERAQVEARNRLLMRAYEDGREEALLETMQALESQRQQDAMIGAAACAATALFSFVAYHVRSSAAAARSYEEMESCRAITVQQQQDLAVEKQRVQELASVNDAQKMLLTNQQKLIDKSKEHNALLRARLVTLRKEHLRLKRSIGPLRVEVKSLAAQNGVLHQRFIASTAGAIIMACVAGGFAIASHGSGAGGDGHSHSSRPQPHQQPTPAQPPNEHQE